MRLIKVAILIFVFSTNLMMGQKNDTPIIKTKCQEKPVNLRILQTTPKFAQIIIENCSESEIETGAFFRFAAF